MKRTLPLLLLTACAEVPGEADDLCVVERIADPLEDRAWTIGAQVPLDTGGSVHVQARWPDGAAGPWPVALLLHGAWDPLGTPVTAGTMRADVAGGLVGLHLDLPGNGRTDGENDRRGAGSRAAVAAVLRWAAGDARDLGGCTLAERVPSADPDALYLVGTSNGGNLALSVLADNTLTLPPIAGLVTWETPAGPQFTNVEMGADPTVYTRGTCSFTAESGIVCALPDEPLLPGVTDGRAVLCFDLDEDDACGPSDVNVPGVEDPATGTVYLSPTLAAAAEDAGVLPDGWAGAAEADAWWRERDGARLAADVVAGWPELPVMLLGSEVDHVQTLVDHPHVYGLGEALQSARAGWTRLNPGVDWLAGVTENAPDAPLSLDDPLGALLTEEVEAPVSALLAAAVSELADRRASGDW